MAKYSYEIDLAEAPVTTTLKTEGTYVEGDIEFTLNIVKATEADVSEIISLVTA